MRRQAGLLGLVVGLSLLGGCATPGPVLTSSVGTLRTGLGTARVQSTEAFDEANRTAVDIDIERVLAGPKPTLIEADFPRAFAAADIARWSNAFGVLDAYLASLQKLVDPTRAKETSDNLDALAKEINGGVLKLDVPAEASGAFSTLAGALVQIKAERSATAIMQRTDPAFKAVMAGMADAIGSDEKSGLRGTTRAYWQGKLSNIRADYAEIKGSDAAAQARRRAVVVQFTGAMTERDSAIADLGRLQNSMIALGEAHGAAARGSNGDALFWIGRIADWLDDAKRRTDAAKAAEEEK